MNVYILPVFNLIEPPSTISKYDLFIYFVIFGMLLATSFVNFEVIYHSYSWSMMSLVSLIILIGPTLVKGHFCVHHSGVKLFICNDLL